MRIIVQLSEAEWAARCAMLEKAPDDVLDADKQAHDLAEHVFELYGYEDDDRGIYRFVEGIDIASPDGVVLYTMQGEHGDRT